MMATVEEMDQRLQQERKAAGEHTPHTFTSGLKITHAEVAKRCIPLVAMHVKRDICDLGGPGAAPSESHEVLDKLLPPAVQYAYCYRAGHP